jgi:hypothetical protein
LAFLGCGIVQRAAGADVGRQSILCINDWLGEAVGNLAVIEIAVVVMTGDDDGGEG